MVLRPSGLFDSIKGVATNTIEKEKHMTTIQNTKNTLVIDHDEYYIPLVKTTDGDITVTANFSLAEQTVRSSERLKLLIDFIRRHNHNSTHRNHNDASVGLSHRLAAQIVYLAYWENFPLEFKIQEDKNILVLVRFPRQPELTFTLDVFQDGTDPFGEIQGWWDFFCEIISAHADIWQIHLAVDESIYLRLNPNGFPRVQIDIVQPLCTIQQMV
jgi:hypothetical protein